MKSFRWAIGTSAIALLLASCGGANPDASSTTSQGEETLPAPAEPAESAASPDEIAPITDKVNVKPNPVPGLLKPTDADQRLAQIAKGERDPFAASAVPPLIGKQIRPSSRASKPTTPSTTSPIKLPKLGDLPTVPVPAGIGTAPPSVPAAAPLPPAPAAAPTGNLANAVQVTGVMNVKGKLVAIIEAPNEPTSRSVQVGDYLAGGQVKVKRIELGPGGDPIVILEQDGVEVMKSVGRTASASLGTNG